MGQKILSQGANGIVSRCEAKRGEAEGNCTAMRLSREGAVAHPQHSSQSFTAHITSLRPPSCINQEDLHIAASSFFPHNSALLQKHKKNFGHSLSRFIFCKTLSVIIRRCGFASSMISTNLQRVAVTLDINEHR